MYRNILVLVDNISHSDALVGEVGRLVSETDAQVTFLFTEGPAEITVEEAAEAGPLSLASAIFAAPARAIATRRPFYNRDFDQARELALQSQLEQICRPLCEKGINATCAVRLGDAGHVALEYCRAHDIDLVVMPRGLRRGLERLLFGDVADSLLGAGVGALMLVSAAGPHRVSDG